MYSPKIAEHLIPRIYRLARARGQHMTTLVNEALASYLAAHVEPTVDGANPREPSQTTSGTAASQPYSSQFAQQAQSAA